MRKIICRCPSCGGKLIEVIGSCAGVIVICPSCGASVKMDIENNGKIKINLDPTISDSSELNKKKSIA